MRALTKGAAPEILRLKGADWTDDYVNSATPTDRKSKERWRHRTIKESLKAETNSKCAYCEGFVDDVSFPHVEHILPKAHFPELAHEWTNMTSACGRCNLAKDDFYDPVTPILNPYEDDLEASLMSLGSLLDYVAGDTRAYITVTKLKLNRLELVHSRSTRITSIRELLERWHGASGAERSVLEEAIKLDAEQGEFTRSVIAHLRMHNFPI